MSWSSSIPAFPVVWARAHKGVKCFEYMTASGPDVPTDGPASGPDVPADGPASNRLYTKAINEACNEHLDERADVPFTTYDLYQTFVRQRGLSKSYRWPVSGYGSRSIKLARVDPRASINPDSGSQGSDTAHLALRSAFRKTTKLEKDDGESLATEIARAVTRSKLNNRAVDWAGFHKARKALPVADHWDTVRSLTGLLVLHQELPHRRESVETMRMSKISRGWKRRGCALVQSKRPWR